MTDKIVLANPASFQNDATAVAATASNNSLITAAFDNTLSRDGTSPNQMLSTLDMNSNREINLPNPISVTEPVTLGYLNGVLAGGNSTSGLVSGVPVSVVMQPVLNANTIAAADTLLGISPAMQPVVGASTTSSAETLLGISTAMQPVIAGTIANAQTLLGIPGPSTPQIPPGEVLMKWVNSAWTVYKPDGTVLNTSGTSTSGLQEAINYATTNGYSLEVYGPGTTAAGAGVAIIECTTQVNLPAMQNWNMRVYGAIIDFPSSASMSGQSCININTMAFCNIDFDCTIQAASNATHIVQIVHTSNAQPSNNPFIEDNRFHFRTIVAYGGAFTSALNMSGVTWSFNNNKISSEGILAGGFCNFGVLVSDCVGGTSGFVQNEIDISLVVSSKISEVEIGPAGNTSGLIGANIWKFGGLTPSQTGMSSAITTNECFGVYHIGSISINTGTCSIGMQFGTGSKQNQVYCGQNDIGPTFVADSGVENHFFMGGTTNQIVSQVAAGRMFLQSLPTANPHVSGQLYSNAGVVTVSAG
jgi:hypothetical protein